MQSPQRELLCLGWGGCALPRGAHSPASSHPQMQEEYVMGHRARDLEAVGEEEQGPEGEAERAAGEGAQEAPREEAGEEEEEKEAELELELDAEQEAEGGAGGRRPACSPDDDFEEELMAQLQEYEQVIQEFQFELEVARTRLSLATGRRWRWERPPPQAGRRGWLALPRCSWGVSWSPPAAPGDPRPPLAPAPLPLLAQEPAYLCNAKWITKNPSCRRPARRTSCCRRSFGSGSVSYRP